MGPEPGVGVLGRIARALRPQVISTGQGEPLEALLRRHDVDPELLSRLLTSTPPGDPRALTGWLAARIAAELPRGGPVTVRRDRASVVALIGPTGVGKTTTTAKIAAIASLKEGRTVGLISTDSYRVAATEQIKRYGRLLSLPVELVRGPDELGAALERLRHRDLILVDTAGQSPHDQGTMGSLLELLRGGPPMKRLLVLSATTRGVDLRSWLGAFGEVGFDGLVVSKLDECQARGHLVNLPWWSGRPLTYLTMGQEVPRQVEVATPEVIAAWLLGLRPEIPAAP